MVLLYRFLRICAAAFAPIIKKRMAHLRQSIFCVKIQKHLDCAKGIADHDSGLLHPVNLRSVTLYTGWMASISGSKASFLKMAQVRHSVFFSLALKRPIKTPASCYDKKRKVRMMEGRPRHRMSKKLQLAFSERRIRKGIYRMYARLRPYHLIGAIGGSSLFSPLLSAWQFPHRTT